MNFSKKTATKLSSTTVITTNKKILENENSEWHFSVKTSGDIHAIMGLCCEFITKVENSRTSFFTSHFGSRVQCMRFINNVSILHAN